MLRRSLLQGNGDYPDRLQAILARNRWYFVKVGWRRRIGKTALIQRALQAEVDQLSPQASRIPGGLLVLGSIHIDAQPGGDRRLQAHREDPGLLGPRRYRVDMVAVAGEDEILRLVTCKRSPERLVADLPRFDGHVARFVTASPRFGGWKIEKVAVAPSLDEPARRRIVERGYIAEDLNDLTRELLVRARTNVP
jgi:hypothetical protein